MQIVCVQCRSAVCQSRRRQTQVVRPAHRLATDDEASSFNSRHRMALSPSYRTILFLALVVIPSSGGNILLWSGWRRALFGPRSVRDLSRSDINAIKGLGVDLHDVDAALSALSWAGNSVLATPLNVMMRDLSPEAFLTTPELIRRSGYPAEVHTVVTEDGYMLEVHRMPPKYPDNNNKVVYLQHGILCSSSDWIIAGPQKGLAYLLHEGGYDVWMGNFRGNRYSRRHIDHNRDPDQQPARFWDFTFHELGMYDLPAAIDYILKKTGQVRLQYVAHSMGTTAFWVMCSEKPEYAKKVISMSAMAPVAFMSAVRSPLLRLGTLLSPVLLRALNLLGVREFAPNNLMFTLTGQIACKKTAFTQAICYNIMFMLAGYDAQQLDTTLLPVLLAHMPAGTSVKTLEHFTQSIKTGKFRRFSFGYFGNLRKYGSFYPPAYDLSRVQLPVSLHYGNNDWVAGVSDVEQLAAELPDVQMYHVSYEKWNHLDFLWGLDVKTMVYDGLLEFLDRHAKLHSSQIYDSLQINSNNV